MSKPTQPLPLSAVIFDRTQKGIPDVPVFASALKQKVNNTTTLTPALSLGAQAILARAGLLEHQAQPPATPTKQQSVYTPTVESTLRADPVRGQTTGFAQSVESISVPEQTAAVPQSEFVEVVPKKSVETRLSQPVTERQPFAFLAEDPTLVRWNAGDTSKLHDYLQVLTTGISKQTEEMVVPKPQKITIPALESELLSSQHHFGIIDRVIIPQTHLTVADRVEPGVIWIRSHYWKIRAELEEVATKMPTLRSQIHDVLADLFVFLKTLESHGAQKIQDTVHTVNSRGKTWVRDHADRLHSSATTRIHPIPRPSMPSIAIPDWKSQFLEIVSFIHPIPVDGSMPTIRGLQLPSVQLPSLDLGRTVQSVIQQLRTRLLTLLDAIKAQGSRVKGPSVSHLFSRVLIATSLVMMLMTVGPMVALEANSWKQKIIFSLTPSASDQTGSPLPSASATPTPNPEPDKQFQILIPKLGVNSRIIANVNPAVEKEYAQALKLGVAHAAGTGLPGEENTHNRTIFVFGHSTNGSWNISRYNALFYSLKDLIIGDSITVWFWGKEFDYTVKERKIVEPDDVSFLQPQTDKERLILQTCWPPGTTWKRLLVIAEPTS